MSLGLHEAKKVLREIRLLRDFRHPNIIWLHALVPPASMETFNDIWIVTDYMDGDLRRIIKSKKEIEPMKVPRRSRRATRQRPRRP